MRGSLLTSLVGAALVVGCSAIPNMDEGSSGCQNARGIGVASDSEPAILAQVEGMTAMEAGATMAAQGHTVVFNTGGDCWCVPPPGGKVTDAWFGDRGALWLWVDGVDPALTAGEPPSRGYGC
jgi:hypothetical protein